MTDIELLPLPEWAACDETVADMSTADVREAMADYARANMEPLKAEIERLRAEREVIVKEATKYAGKSGRLEAEVDRLQAELDNRWAQGVHTCHDKCQRIACVLLRDNKRLAEALRDLLSRAPGGYECGDFHHSKDDRHGPLDACPPMQRWHAALDDARAALRDHDQEATND